MRGRETAFSGPASAGATRDATPTAAVLNSTAHNN